MWRLDEAEPEFTFAVNFIGRTLQLKPDFAEAQPENILLRLNQPERARTEYEEYLPLAPKGEHAAEARKLIQKLQKVPESKSERKNPATSMPKAP